MKQIRYKSLAFLGYPGYRVGSDGSVWTQFKTKSDGHKLCSYYSGIWKQLKPCKRSKKAKLGYLTVSLYKDGKAKAWIVHTLVLSAFVGPCPPGMEACHFPDRNIENNRTSNLKWGTRKENHEHQQIHGTKAKAESHGMAKLTVCKIKKIRALYNDSSKNHSMKSLAKAFHVSRSQIFRILHQQSWSSVKGPSETNFKRVPKGENRPFGLHRKLTNNKVRKIRKLHETKKYTQKQLSEMFQVGEDQISRIINRKSWNHI
jgi:hypothetical protein